MLPGLGGEWGHSLAGRGANRRLNICHSLPVILQEQNSDFDTFCMLGEALMQIQEPEKAVRAFEDALEYQPKVGGRALVCCLHPLFQGFVLCRDDRMRSLACRVSLPMKDVEWESTLPFAALSLTP